MEIDFINLITQNGIGVVCVIFLMYFINTTLKDNNKILDEIQQTLVSINTNLTNLSTRVDKLEEKIVKKKTKKEEEK